VALVLVAGPVYAIARRLRGAPKPERRPWTLEAAALAIRRFNTRRAWRRAYAARL
jgi:hypothetical protein